MLRALVKTAAAEAICRTGADRLLRARTASAEDPLVLGYHQVVEDPATSGASIPAMVIGRRTLERQLDEVGRSRRFVSLDELGARLENGDPAGRLAAVTFDDGYRDVYEHAFPLLERMGIPAAVFVVTDFVGTSRLQRHDRLYRVLARHLTAPAGSAGLAARLTGLGLDVPRLQRRPPAAPLDAVTALRALLEALTTAELERVLEVLGAADPGEAGVPELMPLRWDMVTRMHRAGVTIGSHTCGHMLLSHESRETVRQELRASRRELERRLGAPVRHLAYPDGRFDTAVVEEAAEAGYRFAYTTCRDRDVRHPLLTIPRRLQWEGSASDRAGRFSPSLMRCQVEGVFDLASRCRQEHHGRVAGARACARPA
jgi:peptidoglycan/xylan/chitin deacetylase (PgdA/CDA1 family)